MASQPAQGVGGGWSIGWMAVGYAVVGAALYAFANWTTLEIQIPGTDDVSIRPQFGLVTFFGFAFGPIVGFVVGFLGNVIGDQLSGTGAFSAWPWSLSNGAAGFLAGVAGMVFGGSLKTSGNRALLAAAAGVLATVLGFGFIWIELITQPELGADYILNREYVPTVVANALVAAVVTPVLVLGWEPLREQLRP